MPIDPRFFYYYFSQFQSDVESWLGLHRMGTLDAEQRRALIELFERSALTLRGEVSDEVVSTS